MIPILPLFGEGRGTLLSLSIVPRRISSMSTEKSFLQAVCETPNDDTPRLVFADWLEDNDQPQRAEFIRLQCRLAAMSAWDNGYDELVVRQQQLLHEHGKQWGKAAAKFTARIEFRRGFVEGMALPTAKFLANAGAIFATTPLLALRPLQVRPSWSAFLASPHLTRLRSLDLHFSALAIGRTQALAGCERLAGLHELNLAVNGARHGAASVLRSSHLGELRRLRLQNNKAGDVLAEALAEADRFPHLRQLSLENNGISADGARQLARAAWLGRLESLGLAENPIGDSGIEALAASEVWAGLRTLTLRQCDLTAACGRHLARCRHLRGLIELSIQTSGQGNIVGELALSPHLRQLRTLDIFSETGLSEGDAEALVRSPLAPRLRCLRLRRLSRATQKILLTAPSLSGLTSLCISGLRSSPPDGQVGKWIREATHLTNLTHLDVKFSQLGNAGVADLAQSPHLARLTFLEIDSNHVTAEGYRALVESPYLNAVKKVSVGLFRWEEETRQMLQARFGEVT